MEQKWKILSSAAGAGASATSFVEEEEEKEKSRWKPAPCVLLSKSSSSSVRARLDPKEGKRRQKIYKSEEENANRCTMQNADPGQNVAREPHTEGGGWRRIFFLFFFLSVAQPDQKTHTCQSERWCSTAAPLSGIEMQSNKWRSSDARTHEATSRVLLSTALRLRHQQDDWIWQIFRTVAVTLKLVAFFNGMGFLFLFLSSFILRLFWNVAPMCRVRPHQRVAVFSKAIVRATFCPSVLKKGGLQPLLPGLQKDAETSHDISR